MVSTLLITVASVFAAWLTLLVALFAFRPDGMAVASVARLLRDTLRLVRNLAREPALPRSTRWSLWLLLAYLACPIDLVPDFIPIIGMADDFIITSVVLRLVVKHAGADVRRVHWTGTPEGLATIERVLRLPREHHHHVYGPGTR